MIRHMVMFRKKSETDEATLQEIMARLEGLQDQIPSLLHIRCYPSLPSDRPVVWTFLLDSSVTDAEALDANLKHPAHVAVNEWMSPFLECHAVIDDEE